MLAWTCLLEAFVIFFQEGINNRTKRGAHYLPLLLDNKLMAKGQLFHNQRTSYEQQINNFYPIYNLGLLFRTGFVKQTLHVSNAIHTHFLPGAFPWRIWHSSWWGVWPPCWCPGRLRCRQTPTDIWLRLGMSQAWLRSTSQILMLWDRTKKPKSAGWDSDTS